MNQKILLLFIGCLSLPQFCILLWAIQAGFGFTYATISTLILNMIILYHYNRARKLGSWGYINDPKQDYLYISLIYLWPISFAFVFLNQISDHFGADIIKHNSHFILWIKSLPFPKVPISLNPSNALDATVIYIFTLLVYISTISVFLSILFWQPLSEAYESSFNTNSDNRIWLTFVSALNVFVLLFLYFNSAGYDFVSHVPPIGSSFNHVHSYDRHLASIATGYLLGTAFFPKLISIILGSYRYALKRDSKDSS